MAFQTEFAEINQKLDNLDNPSLLDRFGEGLFSIVYSFVYDIFSWVLTVICTISGIGKLVMYVINQLSGVSKEPESNPILIRFEYVFGSVFRVSGWILAGIVFLMSIDKLASSIIQTRDRTQLVAISNQLEQIQTQLETRSPITPIVVPITETSLPTITPIFTSSPTPTAFLPAPTPTVTPGADLKIESQIFMFIAVGMGLGLLALFAFLASKLAKYQTQFYGVNVSRLRLQSFSPELTRAGLLILVLFLLPYPVEEILLPLLVPFLIFAFLDIVRFYPNLLLKDLVIRHYPKIIFGAVFGAWYSFLSVLKSYGNPIWLFYESAWDSVIRQFMGQQNMGPLSGELILNSKALTNFLHDISDRLPFILTQFSWDFIPILLAILLAIGPYRQIKRISEGDQIKKIEQSIKQSSTSKFSR